MTLLQSLHSTTAVVAAASRAFPPTAAITLCLLSKRPYFVLDGPSPSPHTPLRLPQPRLMDMAWPERTEVDGPAAEKFPDEVQEASIPVREKSVDGVGQQGFEGPEKTLEIEFDPDVGNEGGLRAVSREQWDAILQQVKGENVLGRRGLALFKQNYSANARP